MIKRYIIFAVICAPVGIVIIYFGITSENQSQWILTLLIFFVLASIVGNWYIFFYKGNDLVRTHSRGYVFRYLFYYGGAILFFMLSLQVLFRGLVLGLGVGLEYFTDIPETYENLSTPRLASWLASGIFFILTSVALMARSRRALTYMTLGTAVFLSGAAYDRLGMAPGTYEPPVGQEFVIGLGLAIWILAAIMFRIRGAFR